MLVEHPTAVQADAHDMQEIAAHRADIRGARLPARHIRSTRRRRRNCLRRGADAKPRFSEVLHHRQSLSVSGGVRAAERFEPAHQFFCKIELIRGCATARQRDAEGQQIAPAVTGIDAREVDETANQQQPADDEHDRHRDFRNHQQPLEAMRPPQIEA